jgi:DNA polymerase-3 subunit alpha
MENLKDLTNYLESKLIKYTLDLEGEIIKINNTSYSVAGKDELIFDEDMDFLPTTKLNVHEIIYNFAGRWYSNEIDEKLTLKELIYKGDACQKIPTKTFLGIRSGYELGNGLSNYSNYIDKAKFLGVKYLGICEKNTLAGVLDFQKSCLKSDIKSIIGMTITVQGKECAYDAKVYAKNFQGWLALLKFNENINVNEHKAIGLDLIEYYKKDIYFVADPKSMPYNERNDLFDFYQLDTVNFMDEERDVEFLNNFEKYLKSNLSPISITDSFYLEKEDYKTREFLWTFLKKFDDKTDNQYFKSKDQYAKELITMFEKSDTSWIKIFKDSVKNELVLADGCNFEYDTDTRHLPRYMMNEQESGKFETNSELFLHLVKKGLKEKGLPVDDYIGRLKEEIRVLKLGDVIDYFLSQYDVMQFAKSKGMLTGLGRGSAAGCLIAYLLDITKINPLDFDLLFERFLNSGRMGSFEDRPEYKVETDTGKEIVFQEGDLVRIIRNERETVVYIENLKENDEIVRY